MRRFALLFAMVFLACGPDAPKAKPVRKDAIPSWADVFDGTPDIYGVIRPKALQHDPLYGSLWQTIVRLAQSRGIARGASMVDAVSACDEIIVGVDKGADAAFILRGVPASVDPQTINDERGQPMFHLLDERAKVPEYQLPGKSGSEGALFVLPDRTWVGALGSARQRAHQVFATPLHRPPPIVAPEALVVARFSGGFPRLFDRHPTWGRLAKGLNTATFALEPNKGGVLVSLAYDDDAQTAYAEMEAKRLADEIGKSDKRFEWLKDAKIAYEGKVVMVRVFVPPRLLEELPKATGADVSL